MTENNPVQGYLSLDLKLLNSQKRGNLNLLGSLMIDLAFQEGNYFVVKSAEKNTYSCINITIKRRTIHSFV